MKTFKEFQEEKKKQAEETKKRRLRPSEETEFGQHSVERQSTKKKKKVSEALDEISEAVKFEHQNEPEKLSAAHHDHIHKIIAPSNRLVAHEKETIADYTDYSAPMNNTLIHYHSGHSINQAYKPQIEKTSKILSKHKTTGDAVVYTGVKRSPARHFTEGQDSVEVHHPAFISTSSAFEMAKGFSKSMKHPANEKHGIHLDGNGEARHVLKLHIPEGTRAMSVKKHTFLPKEHEILLDRGHDIEIHHKPTVHVDKDGTKYHVWHAKVVGHSPANLDGEDL